MRNPFRKPLHNETGSNNINIMKKVILISAFLVLGVSYGLWILHGARIGWTTTEKAIPMVDEITGIEYTEYEKGLNFGVELPVVGTMAALGLFGLSLLLRKSKN
jgi:hypothetical protein